jgi:hypothetical protein
MKISEVKTAKKVGDFKLRNDGSPNKIKLDYSTSELTSEQLKQDDPRVYLIVSDGEIKKIGGSSSKGGIKATMSFYVNARTGSPGPVRFIIHELIRRELANGKKVELYMITSPRVKSKVCGLFDCNKEIEVASFKEMEDRCKEDYYKKEGRYPDWNFQENNESYSEKYNDIYKEYLEYHKNRTS